MFRDSWKNCDARTKPASNRCCGLKQTGNQSSSTDRSTSVQLDVIREDPPDNRILECAVSSGSDFIVTGDKDLLRLKWYDSIQIVTLARFVEMVADQNTGA